MPDRFSAAESIPSEIWYAVPAESKLTHGSVERSKSDDGFAHLLKSAKFELQLSPPSNEWAATSP